jgi:hypothetical protein
MGDVWIPIVEILSSAGLPIGENHINAGWQQRSRSSGGFNVVPLAVQWHHTASSASVDSDLSYMINGSPDEPVGNVYEDRNGIFWPIAAGAANTSGKGGPNAFSRGSCPKDSGNTHLFSIEIANNGVGERYPQVQIDNAFRASNALNEYFGNQPHDVITHALGEGDGYTDRKIDPATDNVEGPWQPRGVNSSGTWRLTDLQNECNARAGSSPGPGPTPPMPGPRPGEGVITMYTVNVSRYGWPSYVTLTVAADGVRWNRFDITGALDSLVGVGSLDISKEQLLDMLGDRTGHGPCPFDPAIMPDYADAELAAAW